MIKIQQKGCAKVENLIERIGVPLFVQVIIEWWNGIFMIMMISCLCFSIRSVKKHIPKYTELFSKEIMIFFVAAYFYNLQSIMGVIYVGDDTPIHHTISYIANFLYFFTGAFLSLLFLQIIKTYVAKKNNIPLLKNMVNVIQSFHIILIGFLFSTPFTDALFYMDKVNNYYRGKYFFLWNDATIITFLFIFIVMILYRKKIDILLKAIILTASIIPTIGFIINTKYTGVSINNISVSVTVLIIFMCYEKRRSFLAAETAQELQITQTELAEKKLALEHSKNEILLAQIQPHFINNSLVALSARCINYPDIYESMTNFNRYLRSHFEALGNLEMIPFEHEMENIEAYLALESDNYGDRLKIEYDIESDDFLVPALSVQPLVENAVRHGVATYDKGGTVTISAHRYDSEIIIEITDCGIGNNTPTAQQSRRKSIGVENVRARLRFLTGGKLEIVKNDSGTTARIIIKIQTEPSNVR